MLARTADLSLHVRLSAVCGRWRACLARRRALAQPLPPDEEAAAGEEALTPPRDDAFVAVLGRCVALEALTVARSLLTEAVLGALGALPCARTLRTLRIADAGAGTPSPGAEADHLLAALPALEALEVVAGHRREGDEAAEVRSFGWRWVRFPVLQRAGGDGGGSSSGSSVHELAVACSRRLSWAALFPELRCLRLQLPDEGTGQRGAVLGGLRAIVPRLEALELRWKGRPVNVSELAELLGVAAATTALRELLLPDRVEVDDAFMQAGDEPSERAPSPPVPPRRPLSAVGPPPPLLALPFSPRARAPRLSLVPVLLRRLPLAGLEALTLCTGATTPLPVAELLARLPHLRAADLEDRAGWEPARRYVSAALRQLRLVLPGGVVSVRAEVAMPALVSLEVVSLGPDACCAVECPALERLVAEGVKVARGAPRCGA